MTALYAVSLLTHFFLHPGLLDDLAIGKYIMPETSSDEEYTKHQNSTLKAGYKILRVNNGKTCLTYSNGDHTHKAQEYKMVALKLYKFKGNIYGGERILVFQILLRSYFITISIRIFY